MRRILKLSLLTLLLVFLAPSPAQAYIGPGAAAVQYGAVQRAAISAAAPA